MVECQSVEPIAKLFTVESGGCLPNSDKNERDLHIGEGCVGAN
jgi:hypothetical protein